MNVFDLTIIGGGPAGVSAALYAVRAGFKVLIIHNGALALEKAHKIENYYGFPAGISGAQLYENGIEQAQNIGAAVVKAEVTNVSIADDLSFNVVTKDNVYNSASLIFATGNKKLRPPIKNIADFEGKGVSYCAICDAFFYRKKNVVVIGNGQFALSEAEDLKNVVSSLTILTNGEDAQTLKNLTNDSFKIDERKITDIKGNEQGKVSAVVFSDGSELQTDGIFIALGEAGACNFAKKIGILLNGDSIKTDEKMQTSVPGIFACGNATGGLLQVSKAVYEGAVAGLSAVDFLKKKSLQK